MQEHHGSLSSGTGTLGAELNLLAYRECIPLNVSCEITLRCNIRCEHCYNFDRDVPYGTAAASRELSFEEWKRVLAELREAGSLFLSFTGGEVLRHPRFFDFLDESARLHFAVQILTNGTLLLPRTAERIASYPHVMTVGISLYGATAATHDAVTQVPGSFRRTLDGAGRLRDAGVSTSFKFIIMRRNRKEAGAMMELADELGFSFLMDTTITGRYDGQMNSLATRVTPGELEELYRGPLRSLLEVRDRDPGEEDWTCNCARGNCAISATGDVYPCIAVPWKAGNVREQPFAEIWRSSPVFRKIRALRLSDFEHCKPCEFKRWCKRSPGAVFLSTADYTSIDPWVCEEAEIIKKVVGDTKLREVEIE